MKDNNTNRNLPVKQIAKEVGEKLTGYPASPDGDDIYNKYQEEKDIDPEDISKLKDLNEVKNMDPNNEKNFSDDDSGNDLDVPGSGSLSPVTIKAGTYPVSFANGIYTVVFQL